MRDNNLDMYMEVLKQKFIDERKSGWKKMFFVPAAYYNLLTHEGTLFMQIRAALSAYKI